MLFPVYPNMILNIVNGDTSQAAHIAGYIAMMIALLKLFSNPLIGTISDTVGRKTLFVLSLASHIVAWGALARFPTLYTIIFGKAIIGCFDAVYVLAYAMFGDMTLAGKSGNSDTTQSFGLVGAAFGFGLVLGPVTGGLLSNISDTLPFTMATVLAIISTGIATYGLTETKGVLIVSSSFLPSFSILCNVKLLSFTVPLFLLEASTGIHTIFFLYTNYRFGWDQVQNGVFLSVVGLSIVTVQGLLLRLLIPNVLTEWKAVLLGLTFKTLSMILLGFNTNSNFLYAIGMISALDGLASPSLRSLMTQVVPPEEQGSLQGALGSLTTLAMAISSPIFAKIFMESISKSVKESYPASCPIGFNHTLHHQVFDANCGGMPGLPYYVDSIVCAVTLLIVLVTTYYRFNDTRAAAVTSDSGPTILL